jgi:Uma2 family endonuclease
MNITVNPPPVVAIMPPLSPEDSLYEIVDGQRVELPPMSIGTSVIATNLTIHLGSQTTATGRTVMEGLFHLALPVDRNRRPDVAYVSFDRWAKDRPVGFQNAWDVVPDAAIEVISPNEMLEDVLVKLEEYFRAGVRVAWVVFPRQQLVYVYESYTQIRVLTRADTLDGGAVVPGFRLALSELFPTA